MIQGRHFSLDQTTGKQRHFFGPGTIHQVKDHISDMRATSVLLVTGTKSFSLSGAEQALAGLERELQGEARAGTPAYMAPEQWASNAVSVQSDIYSLGLVLHEIFTGKKAFDGASVDHYFGGLVISPAIKQPKLHDNFARGWPPRTSKACSTEI